MNKLFFLATFLFTFGLNILAFALDSANDINIRTITTNMTESAPLNLVSRGFRLLEPYFDDHLLSQRLTYRVHRKTTAGLPTPLETALQRLLINIGGGNSPNDGQVTVQELVPASDSASARTLLGNFATLTSQAISSKGNAQALSQIPLRKFAIALNALTARQDLKVFAAKVNDDGFDSRVLILLDEETEDLLLLYLTRPPNEI